MKSREARKREAWQLIAWVGAVVAGLLILYYLSEGAPTAGGGGLGPLLGAGIGASLTYLFTQQQRREDEQRRRRALATFLLSEIQVLHSILEDIYKAYHSKALHKVGIEPFHTAMYEQAGGDRLLFQSETAQVLAQFYSLVYILRMELTEFRGLPPEQRAGREDALRFRTLYIAERIQEVMHKLSAEGGVWPSPFPSRTYTSVIKFFVLDVFFRRVVAVSSDPAPDSAFALSFFGRPSGQLP